MKTKTETKKAVVSTPAPAPAPAPVPAKEEKKKTTAARVRPVSTRATLINKKTDEELNAEFQIAIKASQNAL